MGSPRAETKRVRGVARKAVARQTFCEVPPENERVRDERTSHLLASIPPLTPRRTDSAQVDWRPFNWLCTCTAEHVEALARPGVDGLHVPHGEAHTGRAQVTGRARALPDL